MLPAWPLGVLFIVLQAGRIISSSGKTPFLVASVHTSALVVPKLQNVPMLLEVTHRTQLMTPSHDILFLESTLLKYDTIIYFLHLSSFDELLFFFYSRALL